MAVTTAIFWCSLVLTVIGANGSGEISILHSPDSLSFTGSGRGMESMLKEIFSAALGLSVEENSEWKGLTINNPFDTPEAIVEVYIDGVPSLGNSVQKKVTSFPLVVDEYEPDTYDVVRHRIRQRYANTRNYLININLWKGNELEEFGVVVPNLPKRTYQHLKPSVEEDHQFLRELENLKAIVDKVDTGEIIADNVLDIFNFRFHSLHALCDFHGPNSLQAKEAKQLLSETLGDLTKAFVKTYDGSVLVTAVTTDVAHTRRAVRSLRTDSGDNPLSETYSGNPEDSYSADSAAIFNILLWFGVTFTFTLIAIMYTFMDMDPGRDSIIYRMTSTRIKKDN